MHAKAVIREMWFIHCSCKVSRPLLGRCGSFIVHAKLAVMFVTFRRQYTELVSKSEMLVPCISAVRCRAWVLKIEHYPLDSLPPPSLLQFTHLLFQLGVEALRFVQVGLELGDLCCEWVGLLNGLASFVLGCLTVHLLLLQVFLKRAQTILHATLLLVRRISAGVNTVWT